MPEASRIPRPRPERALSGWYHGEKRKPLVIQGARQVGKSTLVRLFCQRNGITLAEVNLERHPALHRIFESLDPVRITRELEALTDVELAHPNALLFLDEIQACPPALAALRYLHEERPELAVVGAGSLLEFTLVDHTFSMPVGRIEYLHLGPLEFSEFLEALGERSLANTLAEWSFDVPFTELAHQRLLELQRQYLYVGGLPEAVADYAHHRSYVPVATVHRSIAATYQDDFTKYGARGASPVLLRKLFNAIPGVVSQKIKYSNLSRDERARTVGAALDQLALARVLWKVHHSDCSGLPIEAQIDSKIFKCLFLDVGLQNHILGFDGSDISNWDEHELVNEGSLAEQFIGQHLLFRRGCNEAPSLCYWLREGRSNNAEVDYVIADRGRMLPVEVKAGNAGRLRSLHQFIARKLPTRDTPLAVRFDLNPPAIATFEHPLPNEPETSLKYRLMSLPLYLVEQLGRLSWSLPETA